jgi:hypothetical protein
MDTNSSSGKPHITSTYVQASKALDATNLFNSFLLLAEIPCTSNQGSSSKLCGQAQRLSLHGTTSPSCKLLVAL